MSTGYEDDDEDQDWPSLLPGLDDAEPAGAGAAPGCSTAEPYTDGPLTGVTPAQVEVCVKVLQAIRVDVKSFVAQGSQKGNSATPAQRADAKAPWDDDCRALRKQLMPLVECLSGNLYAGRNAEEYKGDRWLRKEKRGKEAQARAMDARRINNTRLRSARLVALQKLQEQPGDVPLIPDGAVADDATVCGTLASGAAAAAAGGWAAYYAGVTPTSSGQGAIENSDVRSDLCSARTPEPEPELGLGLDANEDSEKLAFDRSCYTCKSRYRVLHHFYDQLCPDCAALNWRKRTQTATLEGRVAVVTGGRVKIGFQVVLKLLRAGAKVDTARRIAAAAAAEDAAEDWAERCEIHGLDLRDVVGLSDFIQGMLRRYDRVDILINNATQTIRRPAAYYRHLLPAEAAGAATIGNSRTAVGATNMMLREHFQLQENRSTSFSRAMLALPPSNDAHNTSSAKFKETEAGCGHEIDENSDSSRGTIHGPAALLSRSAALSQAVLLPEDAEGSGVEESLPGDIYDVNGQQIDLRRENSWKLGLGEVSTTEAAEALAINTLAPFVLNSKLKPLLTPPRYRCSKNGRDEVEEVSPDEGASGRYSYVINVSAMEGKFYRKKTAAHPHTNMAKAALNMMTRTSAQDYANSGILMNSVDTGWINDENPVHIAERLAAEHGAHGFATPLDEMDAAARILDPVFAGVNEGLTSAGLFFKDYAPTEW